jgi:hypothetical protein
MLVENDQQVVLYFCQNLYFCTSKASKLVENDQQAPFRVIDFG